MELSQNDINFIKTFLGSEDVRVRFVEVVGKFIDELKDIETLPLSEPKKLAEILIDRLDTVKNLNTGFVFQNYNEEELLKSCLIAIKTFSYKNKHLQMVRNALYQDFSWDKSARKYIELYQKIVK